LQTETFVLEDLFSSVLSEFKKYHLSGNLKFKNSGIFQSLELRISMKNKLSISPMRNFSSDTLGGLWLINSSLFHF